MGRIQSNVGLITGIPITDTVDQLIAVASQPRDLLTSRNQGLQQQQVAIGSLSSRLLSLQFDLRQLNVSTPFQSRSVTSQNEEVLTANIRSDGQPSLGTFALQPVQTASSQQFISQSFETLDDIQQTGSLSFGFGGFVNEGISLDELNGGDGVSRGEIRITDLAGNSATVDLSLARTVDDVVNAINNQSAINVTASVDGDRFRLTDNVGGASAITVQEVNGGSTAADLGLNGFNTTDSTDVGADVFSLTTDTRLTSLNDGNGIRITSNIELGENDPITRNDDLIFTLNDGTSDLGVDLEGATTLGDVVDAINNDEDLAGRVTATISADGNRLVLTDSTAGTGFSVSNGINELTGEQIGSAADDLGLTNTSDTGVITGSRLVSGLQDTLVSSLNGGAGLGDLGDLTLTDRNGGTATILEADLSAAETLGEIVNLINNSIGASITASTNDSGSGIELTDTSGGVGNLVVSGTSADALGIAVDAAQNSVDSGSLGRQTLSEATLLSSLDIEASDIEITNSNGSSTLFDLNGANAVETIGDVLDAINNSNAGVTATINESGDGILLTDTNGGEATFGVSDVNGTLAADLNLTRASTTVEVDGEETQVIDGTSRFSVDLSDIGGDSSSISLDSVNSGAGITRSDIIITDSAGGRTALLLDSADAGITTIGQLIDTINERATGTGANVTASINSAGTGIQLTDNSTGDGNLIVEDVNGTAAADLRILSNDNTTDSINGSGLFPAQSASQGALGTVADRINDLEAGVTASVLNDGTGFRLQLIVDEPGAANEILLEAAGSGFEFDEVSSARDALLVLGSQGTPGSGVLVSSSTNDFNNVINGIDLSIQAPSDTPVDVTVAASSSSLVDAVQSFVDSFNAIRSDLDELTDFDSESLTTGLLFGTNEALRVDVELSSIVTDRFFGVGSFQSLEAVGISIDTEGQLSLNTTELEEAFAEDAQSLQTFFTDETNGIVARFDAAIEGLAGADNGLLTNRTDALQNTIDVNNLRIEQFNASLEVQRETLLLQFFQLEQVIGELQNSQAALGSLQPIPPLVLANNNN